MKWENMKLFLFYGKGAARATYRGTYVVLWYACMGRWQVGNVKKAAGNEAGDVHNPDPLQAAKILQWGLKIPESLY